MDAARLPTATHVPGDFARRLCATISVRGDGVDSKLQTCVARLHDTDQPVWIEVHDGNLLLFEGATEQAPVFKTKLARNWRLKARTITHWPMRCV